MKKSALVLVLALASSGAAVSSDRSTSSQDTRASETRFAVVGPYESPFAGLMMLKIDSWTGDSWITTGPAPGTNLPDWSVALANMFWTKIGEAAVHRVRPPNERRATYLLSEPIAFGDFGTNVAKERKRHAVARIDVRTGDSWLLIRATDGAQTFPYHDEFKGLVWKSISEEDGKQPARGHFTLRPLVNAHQVALQGQTLGPALVRADLRSGATWIANWHGANRGDTDMVWSRVRDR